MPSASLIDRFLFGPDKGSRKHEYLSNTRSGSSVDSTKSPTSPAESGGFDDEEKAKQSGLPVRVRIKPTTSRTSRPVHPLVRRWQALWERPAATWHPSFLQIRPIAGILALCVTASCVFAALVILVVSDGQPIESWPIQPTVYLAIVTALSNSGLALARMEAVPISWWFSASRGRTIGSLERQWQISRSVVQAVVHSRHFSLLSLACIAGSLAIIQGPLLQRASRVDRPTIVTSKTIGIPLPAELPNGFSGYAQDHILFAPPHIERMAYDTLNGEPMELSISGCNGTCTATVLGPGVSREECKTETWQITPEMLRSMNATWGGWKGYFDTLGSLNTRLPAFYINVRPSYYATQRAAARLEVGYVAWDEHLHGSYINTICQLVPAIVRYDVVIEGQTIQVPDTPNQGRIVQLANNTEPIDWADASRKQLSTLDSVSFWLGIFKNTNSSVVLSETSGDNATYAPEIATFTPETLSHLAPGWTGLKLGLVFNDPTDDVIYTYNKMMLRGAATTSSWTNLTELVDPGTPIYQNVTAQLSVTQNVYRSDLSWYAGAAIVQLITILLILPMFYGWWTLGCNLTLSPFCIALAMDAPLLRDVNSAAGPRGVVEELGDVKVKFGIVNPATESVTPEGFATGRLGLGKDVNVVRPRSGLKFYG